jgi:hypothetical protein
MTTVTAVTDEVSRCRRKRSYLSRSLAANAAWLLRAACIDTTPLEPYHCTVCDDWHLRLRRSPR